jgi:hypothetical protein
VGWELAEDEIATINRVFPVQESDMPLQMI